MTVDLHPGDRVRLVKMFNDPFPIVAGTEGEVQGVSDWADGRKQVAMKWDNGRTLAMIVPEDEYVVVSRAGAAA